MPRQRLSFTYDSQHRRVRKVEEQSEAGTVATLSCHRASTNYWETEPQTKLLVRRGIICLRSYRPNAATHGPTSIQCLS